MLPLSVCRSTGLIAAPARCCPTCFSVLSLYNRRRSEAMRFIDRNGADAGTRRLALAARLDLSTQALTRFAVPASHALERPTFPAEPIPHAAPRLLPPDGPSGRLDVDGGQK